MSGPFHRLKDLLEEERQALLTAEFGRLPAIAAEKERLATALGRPPHDDMPALSPALSRNAVLFNAALSGLREALAGRDGGFRIYSARGSAETAGGGAPLRLTRRA